MILFVGCSSMPGEDHLFQLRTASNTGIHFSNDITENEEVNVIDFQYCYNGGGVGIGDFNQDGLPDVVFSGNQVSTALYLNKGELSFQDITQPSGVATTSWLTGVSIADVNGDGWDDIYFGVGGANCSGQCENLLYINQGNNSEGIPTFLEKAGEFGLNNGYYTQQTVFFDADRDGDLDAYLLQNGNLKFDKNSPVPNRYFPDHLGDYLLKNEWDAEKGHPVFIPEPNFDRKGAKGFGLGVAIEDFDDNGWPDLYTANDFISNDRLFLNEGSDHTAIQLIESSKRLTKHQTYNAMGVDIADVNNDLRPDILVLDMLPFEYERQKKIMGSMNYEKYLLALDNGYIPQYVRNTLQIHNGSNNGSLNPFSEVAFLSGIAKTDWSWAPLMFDADMDGDKDIFITNGYGKDITDLDFVNYAQQSNMFGSAEAQDANIKQLIGELPAVPLPNFFFENQTDLSFEDLSNQWMNNAPTLSNGAAFADLDLDGDLDMVINNINEKAHVLENTSNDAGDKHWIKLDFKGLDKNTKAIGARVTIWEGDKAQRGYHSLVRGYLSTMESGVYFSLNSNEIDSIEVVWPQGGRTMLKDVQANRKLNIQEPPGTDLPNRSEGVEPTLMVRSGKGLDFTHRENLSSDFADQRLLTTQMSQNGPCMASKGDLLFIGGSHGTAGSIWRDQSGSWKLIQSLEPEFEDADASFFDLEGDGDLDLYVGSGGSEQKVGSSLYQDRIYVNENGGFDRLNGIDLFRSSTSCLVSNDFDQDGDEDLFIGAGIVPGRFPEVPQSRLLRNDEGVLTPIAAESFNHLGMVRDAIWSDLDGDGWDDLIVVGHWMEVRFYQNQQGGLKPWELPVVDESGIQQNTSGWWNAIEAGDLDGDGDKDLVLGNQGLNNFINPSQEHPVYVYHGDFDANGSPDPVQAAFYDVGTEQQLMPMHTRDDILKQLVSLKSEYPNYESFAQTDFQQLLNLDRLEEKTLSITTSAHLVLINEQNQFVTRALPTMSQIAPINDILLQDVNVDGNLDMLAVGNDYAAETHFGRYDASLGVCLLGDGKGNLEWLDPAESGFVLAGQASEMILTGDKLMVGVNDKDLVTFNILRDQ
ncbi:MAG: CRTAC1 family protein [Cytophagales bacterium]|nr:CRTAC1 family protein [Cytophagales bacterium]